MSQSQQLAYYREVGLAIERKNGTIGCWVARAGNTWFQETHFGVGLPDHSANAAVRGFSSNSG